MFFYFAKIYSSSIYILKYKKEKKGQNGKCGTYTVKYIMTIFPPQLTYQITKY